MSKKQINWMLTVWGPEPPLFIKEAPNLDRAWMQKEVTKSGEIHWQAFCRFNCQVTVPALKEFFDKHKRKAHIGQKKGEPVIPNMNAGINYVSGYGPLALSKLLESDERYIIRNNEVIHMPLPEDKLEEWTELSAKTRGVIGNIATKLMYDEIFETKKKLWELYQSKKGIMKYQDYEARHGIWK